MERFVVTRRARLDLLDIAAFTLEEWGVEQMERYLSKRTIGSRSCASFIGART